MIKTGFGKQLESVRKFVEEIYPKHLEGMGLRPPFISEEPIDFDKITKDFVLYMEPDGVNFGPNAWADDCRDIVKLTVNFFLAFRGAAKSSVLMNDKLNDAATAFYNMMKTEKMFKRDFPLAENLTVRSLEFFQGMGANDARAGCRFSVEFDIKYN